MKHHARFVLALALALVGAPLMAQDSAVTHAPADPSISYEEYVIGAHDLVKITVFELDELDRERRVDTDGSITLPLLGQVRLGGLTPKQAEEAIAALLRERNLVKDPQVSVFIEEYRSRMVSVQGAVAKPGVYTMLGQRTLLSMLGEAGGLNERAAKKIVVMRPFAKGGEERIEIDAEELLYEGNPVANIVLQPGDDVFVPYERMMRIYVNGAVRQPGAKEFPEDEVITVLQAVTAAGGTTDRANESTVYVIRKLPDGGEQRLTVNLKRIMRGRAEDIRLEKNDIVVVRESFF